MNSTNIISVSNELSYLRLLINDLEESKGKCTFGFSGNMPISDEINILKTIYRRISEPKIIEKIITKEKIINPKGEKIGLKEIIKIIKKDNNLKSYNNTIKKSYKKLETLKSKISSTYELINKIISSNRLYEDEISIIEKEIETSKSEIHALIKKCFNRGDLNV